MVVWMTGLSGSGKSTIAQKLKQCLIEAGKNCLILDGDIIRVGLNNDLSFSTKDRYENIRRIAEVSTIISDNDLIVLVATISPLKGMRRLAKEIIGENSFIELYINAPLETCEKRDVKGLYKKARSGEIAYFTGIDSVYEPPQKPDIEILTDIYDVDMSVNMIYNYLVNSR